MAIIGGVIRFVCRLSGGGDPACGVGVWNNPHNRGIMGNLAKWGDGEHLFVDAVTVRLNKSRKGGEPCALSRLFSASYS